MELFWLKGYEAASMADLLEATGLTSRSMYNVFGSKNGLFHAALDTYFVRGYSTALTELKQGEGLQAIRDYVQAVAATKPLNGCLYVNTLSAKNSVEADALSKVQDYFENLESIFRSKFAWAKKHSGYTGDPGLRARQLVAFMQGIAVYSKINNSTDEHQRMARDFLNLIDV